MGKLYANRVHSVEKAFLLLRCFVRMNRALSLKELCDMTRWPKSTVHGLLSSLCEVGAVAQQNHNGYYCLGVRLFELGNAAKAQWNVIDMARPLMEKISTKTGESTCLGMFDGDSVLILDCVDVDSPMRVVSNAGTKLPLHASALGKAMTAFMPEEAALLAVAKTGYIPHTPHTLKNADALIAEWAIIRHMHYAVENGELRVGMRSVAAPIFDCFSSPKYAIGVTGMFRRVTDALFLEAQALIVAAAKTISEQMK